MIGAFAGWQEFVGLRLRLKYLATKTFNRLANAHTYGAWEVWTGALEEAREKERRENELQFLTGKEREEELARLAEAEKKKHKGLEMIQRMVNGCLASTLIAWKQFTVQSIKERVLLERFSRRMMMRAVNGCLLSWIGMVRERKWLRGLMKRMLGGKSMRQMRAALQVWVKYTSHQRELAHEHGVTDLQGLVETLHQKCGELEAQNMLLMSQFGEMAKKKNELAQKSMKQFIQTWTNKCMVSGDPYRARVWGPRAKGFTPHEPSS